MRRVVFCAQLIGLIASLAGCELNRSGSPSVLVVAVEGLGFEALSCDSEQTESNEGLSAFCEESVRFSHAYAPSTMSQATMTSLLTGLYPVDHQVHNNGPDFLSARFRTLAEVALAQKYRTLFVSGGPPLWRKSGLAQGFEVFDDQVEIGPGQYYRPADEVFRLTTHWIEHDTGGAPFLSVMFLADLQFPQVATRTNEGEMRERSAAAQLEEVTESLGGLVKWLKNHKRWNGTNIVLVGLNSHVTRENDPSPSSLSLRSSSVQVSLFIKPARKERDNVIQWAVDRNVSLVDVGATMFGWLGTEPPAGSLAEIAPESLQSALEHPDPRWEEDRLILTESGWPDWLEKAGVRWAIRQNQFLFVHDKRPLIFNTLTDRMESMPLKSTDPLWQSLDGDVLGLLQKTRAPAFGGLSSSWLERIDVARDLWRDSNPRDVNGDEPWAKWYLRQALQTRDWPTVKRLSVAMGDQVGAFVAGRQMGEPAVVPKNPCLRLWLGGKGEKKVSDCGDERVQALYAWTAARGEDEKLSAQERFLRSYRPAWIEQDLGRLNYVNELRWDINRDLPQAPAMIDYVLTLKEVEPFAKKISALLNGKDARL